MKRAELGFILLGWHKILLKGLQNSQRTLVLRMSHVFRLSYVLRMSYVFRMSCVLRMTYLLRMSWVLRKQP